MRYITTIIALLLTTLVFSQNDKFITPGGNQSGRGQGLKNQQDSTNKAVDTHIKSWTLTSDFIFRKENHIDSLLRGVQLFDPIFKKSISNTSTGYLGGAYVSNIFIDREYYEDFYFANTKLAYMNTPENNIYFNTTNPYTTIGYSSGGARGLDEYKTSFFHTQNINPFLNVSVGYDVISNAGQYKNQKTKNYNFRFTLNYDKDRHAFYFFSNHNRLSSNENGGTKDDNIIRDTIIDAVNVDINLNGAQRLLSNLNYFAKYKYYLGDTIVKRTKQDTTNVFPYSIDVYYKYELNKHKYQESASNPSYYSTFNMFSDKTSDRAVLNKKTVGINLVANENSKFLLNHNLYAGFKYSYRIHEAHTKYSIDTFNYVTRKNEALYATSAILFNKNKVLNYNANAKYGLYGYNKNDFSLNAKAKLFFVNNDSVKRNIYATFKSSKTNPELFKKVYFSNHFNWEIFFEKEFRNELGFGYQTNNFNIGGNITNLNNYIYFNENKLPTQHKSDIQIYTAYLNHKLNLGNWHLNSKFVYQKSSSDVIALPSYSLYANFYYENTYFDKALLAEFGIDANFHSKFYMQGYIPDIGQFHNQSERKIGEYPYVNIYFNFQIKRTRFYLKYANLIDVINQYAGDTPVLNRDIFTALHYPSDPALFKFGLIWNFYD